MPILSNFLVESDGKDSLRFFATDLEIAVSTSCHAKVKQQGKICVPERKVSEIVRELGKNEIDMTSMENHWVKIESGKAVFQIVGLNADEYPKAFESKEDDAAKTGSTRSASRTPMDKAVFLDLIDRTLFAVLDADYVQYNGILLETEKDCMRMVATDGHRLSLYEKPAKDGLARKEGILIPKKGARELRRILAEMDGDIEVSVGSGFLSVWNRVEEKGETKVMIRLLEGKFPNYREVIPKKFMFQISAEREALVGALKRMAFLAGPLAQGVRVAFQKGELELSLKNSDLGEGTEQVAFETIKEGQDGFEILFNVHYLLDSLGVMTGAKVNLNFSGQEGPLVVESTDDAGYLGLVMPMRS